jgi:hypothetical protein
LFSLEARWEVQYPIEQFSSQIEYQVLILLDIHVLLIFLDICTMKVQFFFKISRIVLHVKKVNLFHKICNDSIPFIVEFRFFYFWFGFLKIWLLGFYVSQIQNLKRIWYRLHLQC